MAGFRPEGVLVADDAAPAVQTAAAELRDALARAGWRALPLQRVGQAPPRPAFVVGTPPPGDAGSHSEAADACRAARRGDRFYLWGQGDRGALCAVYGYLQDVLGFRWFTPDVEARPRLEPSAPLSTADFEQVPAFAVRDVGYFEAMQKPWNARLRLNGEFSARGLGPEWGGGMRYTHYVHTFYQLVPPERYFAAHPEYFALVDGRRRPAFAQLCLTNPEIADIAAAEVESWFAADPAARIASVSQNDWLGACECPACRDLVAAEGSQVGPVLHFANAVARRVARRHPDRLIDTLAYWYTEDPPHSVRPEPNVVVRLCHMSPSCESHAVEACGRNAPFAARLEAWSRIAPRLHIWDYHTNFAHFLMPFPNFAAIAADLRLFRRRGVESVFCQGDLEDGGGGEWSTLRAFYLARLLWNPAEDPEALVDGYLAAVFPHSTPHMRAYFDLIQARAADPGRHLRMFSPVQSGHLTPDVVAAAGRSLEDARGAAAAAGDAAEVSQVRRAQLSIDYVRLAMPPLFSIGGGAVRPSVPPGAEGPGFLPPGERPAALSAFMAELERQGIRGLGEAMPLSAFQRRAELLAAAHDAPEWVAGPWRLRIVPDLGGRLWQAAHEGTNLLALPDIGEADYPASRGYTEAIASGLGPAAPFTLTASRGSDGRAAATLEATLEGMSAWHIYAGIAVRRDIACDADGTLCLRTVATNTDTAPHPLAIRPRWHLAGAGAPLETLDAHGHWHGQREPGGDKASVLHGVEGWRVRVGAVTLQCLHGPVDRVEVAAHDWGLRIECVGVQQIVSPGEEVRLEQRWRVAPSDRTSS